MVHGSKHKAINTEKYQIWLLRWIALLDISTLCSTAVDAGSGLFLKFGMTKYAWEPSLFYKLCAHHFTVSVRMQRATNTFDLIGGFKGNQYQH